MRAEILHRNKRNDLVKRSLVIELHLRMLIRHAQRPHWRLPSMHGIAMNIHLLAQRLRPKLRIPFCRA